MLRQFALISTVGTLTALSFCSIGLTQQSSIHAFTTKLSGANEVPAKPAQADGSALVTIYGQNKLCYKLTASGATNLTAAHIHKGAAGVNGPVVVPLMPPTQGSVTHCLIVKPDFAQAVIKNPTGYYVNIHSQAYPDGVMRGQLALK